MSEYRVRAIRGAISVEQNAAAPILEGTRALLEAIIRENAIASTEDIVSIFFTATPDLDATFPAEAARQMGMHLVPLLCASEIAVAGAAPRILRVLLHINTTARQDQIVHVYLGRARALRLDLVSAQ